jgi:peptidyl-tRNA hydrolase
VKRARNKAWDDLADIPEFAAEATWGKEQVRVFVPKPVSTFAPQLQKLQVTGLSMPRDAANTVESDALVIYINEALQMSTGKLVAQVCHAVQLFLMLAPQDRVDAWLTHRHVAYNYVADMGTAPADVIEVHDAGYTEIAANSYTTAADYSKV